MVRSIRFLKKSFELSGEKNGKSRISQNLYGRLYCRVVCLVHAGQHIRNKNRIPMHKSKFFERSTLLTHTRHARYLHYFGAMLDRLENILSIPMDTNDFVVDATLHRFELCYELCWKTLQCTLEHEGHTDARTARETFAKAYQLHWIDNEALWIEMIDDRALVVGDYEEETGHAVYANIPNFYSALRNLHTFINKKYGT